jgi:hypothetical protein
VSLWPGLTDLLFDEIRKTVEGWASGRTNVVLVPTTGLLDPADAASAEESGDWINEIHPNKRGWRKQAAAWRSCLDVHG